MLTKAITGAGKNEAINDGYLAGVMYEVLTGRMMNPAAWLAYAVKHFDLRVVAYLPPYRLLSILAETSLDKIFEVSVLYYSAIPGTSASRVYGTVSIWVFA